MTIWVKGKIEKGDEFPLMLKGPNDRKERQIGLVQKDKMVKDAFTVDKPINTLGRYEIALKDNKGSVVAIKRFVAE